MRLSGYPYVVVRVACTRCPRRGQYRLARLAAQHGPEIELPWLLEELAQGCDLRRVGRVNIYERCEAYFPDLKGPRPPDVPAAMRPKLKAVRG